MSQERLGESDKEIKLAKVCNRSTLELGKASTRPRPLRLAPQLLCERRQLGMLCVGEDGAHDAVLVNWVDPVLTNKRRKPCTNE